MFLTNLPVKPLPGIVQNSTEQFFHETAPYGSCMYKTGGELRQMSVRFFFEKTSFISFAVFWYFGMYCESDTPPEKMRNECLYI